jgi:hypothetical protein
MSYINTKFFQFLFDVKKKHATRYQKQHMNCPLQTLMNLDRRKTLRPIWFNGRRDSFIESMIRPMSEAGFSGLKREQDLEIGNDEENLENS